MIGMRLVRNAPCGLGMRRLIFSAPGPLSALYRIPGQFLEIEVEHERGYFAIASPPNGTELELLVKDQPGPAAHLCALKSGAEVQVTGVHGEGFDLSDVAGRPLHLFSMGSGLAPLRALIISALRGDFVTGPVALWQGSFSREHLPYPEDLEQWEAAGIEVYYCLDGGARVPATVPDRIRNAGLNLAESICFWVGSPEFGQSVRAAALEMKARPDRVRTNF